MIDKKKSKYPERAKGEREKKCKLFSIFMGWDNFFYASFFFFFFFWVGDTQTGVAVVVILNMKFPYT